MNAASLIDSIIAGSNSKQIQEATIFQLAWNRLPPKLKSKINQKRLADFLDALDDKNADLGTAAKMSKIPLALAVDLMQAIERGGLL